MHDFLVLGLEDGTGHFLPRDAMLVRSLSVWCRAVGRFLENRVFHRFQLVELTHTGKSRAAS